MKKKILAVLICTMVSVNLLAGCGSSDEPAAEATQAAVTKEADEEEAVTETAASDDMCSNDDFEALQDAYAALAEEYNTVVDMYKNNDDIPQDDEMESLLGQAKEYMDTVGDINQTDITTADAEEIADSMVMVAEGLAQAAEALGIMAENGSASAEMCSDDDFAALQEAYAYLTEEYNMIVDEYTNNDSIPQDDDLESYLADAKSLIEEMGEIEQTSISNADAETLADSMTTVAESLAEVAESIFN